MSLDWAYGDRAEVYAVSYEHLQSLRSYCLNRVGGVYSARLDDEACKDSIYPYPQGFPNYYSRLETALQVLTSYGLEGKQTFRSVPTLQSLPVTTLQSLPFLTKFSTQGISPFQR